jgi:macrodomain Ter protein organizer (MatP/YcbG family)
MAWLQSHLQTQSWDRLKEAMRDRFIPPKKRDLRKKSLHLEQGNMSFQEYYTEFQKCSICCGIVEDIEDNTVCFYGGLRHEI